MLTFLFAATVFFDFGFFWTLIFIVSATSLYVRSPFNHGAFAQSFIVCVLLSLLLPSFFDALSIGFLFLFFVVWYMLFGLQAFLFAERWWWHYALFSALLYAALSWYVLRIDAGGGIFFSTVVFVALLSLLCNELFGTELAEIVLLRRRLTLVALLDLFVLELAWVLRLLPIHPLLIAVIVFFALALSVEFFKSKARVYQHGALFIGFLLIVLLTTQWKL